MSAASWVLKLYDCIQEFVYNLGSRFAWQVRVLGKHWKDRKLGSSFLSWLEGVRVYNFLRAKEL